MPVSHCLSLSRFAKLGQLRAIIPFVPVRAPQLSAKLYEMVLNFFIVDDTPGLLRVLAEWPRGVGLFEPQTIITRIIDRLQIVEQVDLLHALAQLYIMIGQTDKALNVYLRLRQGDVFGLIEKYNLYESVRDKVLPLVLFDKARAIHMLMVNVAKISVAEVVRQLAEQPRLQHEYLHTLFYKDTTLTVDHQELQVALYAEFDPPLLMGFLRQSNYKLENALDICRAKKLYKEEVFILGRMGNCNDALALIIHKLGDVQQAIDFIVEYGGSDSTLWEELVNWCLQSEHTIGDLLDRCPQVRPYLGGGRPIGAAEFRWLYLFFTLFSLVHCVRLCACIYLSLILFVRVFVRVLCVWCVLPHSCSTSTRWTREDSSHAFLPTVRFPAFDKSSSPSCPCTRQRFDFGALFSSFRVVAL